MIKRAGLCLVLFPKLFAQIASTPFALGAWQSPIDSPIPAAEFHFAAGPADLYRLALKASTTHFTASAWQEGSPDLPQRHFDFGTHLSLNRDWQVEVALGLDQTRSLSKSLPSFSLALAYQSTYWIRLSSQPYSSLSYPILNVRTPSWGRQNALIAGYRYTLPSEYGARLELQLGLYPEEATWALGWHQNWRGSNWQSLLAFESGPYPLRLCLAYQQWQAALRIHGQLIPSVAVGWHRSLAN